LSYCLTGVSSGSAGSVFYDAAYLSFVNIAQAAEHVQGLGSSKKMLTICCTQVKGDLQVAY
jgi:hypothetical protein